MIVGASGGEHQVWEDLLIENNWGWGIQTGFGSLTVQSINPIVRNVVMRNNGSKGISHTRSRGGGIFNCDVEINAYTDAENPGGAGAASGSCFEASYSYDATIAFNRGKHVGASQRGPGIRAVNDGSNLKVIGNAIDDASYGLFVSSVKNYEAHSNVFRNIQGNGIAIFDADVDETFTTSNIRIHHNHVVDPTAAYVMVSASKSGMNAYVEAFINDNTFEKTSGGSPTHGIYNDGVVSPAIGGSCEVYAWNNNFVGSIPNLKAGAAAHEIMPAPESGWRVLGQSNVAASYTGGTSEQILGTVIVPAYPMGKNGRLRITASWSFTNNANAKTTRLRFGGLQAYSQSNTSVAQHRPQIEIGNRNSLASQVVMIPGSATGFGQSTTATGTMTIDTSAASSVTITGQLADGADTITLESYIVEVMYGL
jgi:hypothetical protein